MDEQQQVQKSVRDLARASRMPSIYVALMAGSMGIAAFFDPTGFVATLAVIIGLVGFGLGIWVGHWRKPFLSVGRSSEALETLALVRQVPGKQRRFPGMEVLFRRARLRSAEVHFRARGSQQSNPIPWGLVRQGLNKLVLVSGPSSAKGSSPHFALLLAVNGTALTPPVGPPVWLRWEDVSSPPGNIPGPAPPIRQPYAAGSAARSFLLMAAVCAVGATLLVSGPNALAPSSPAPHPISGMIPVAGAGMGATAGPSPAAFNESASQRAITWPLYMENLSTAVGEQTSIVVSCAAATGAAIMLIVGQGELDFGDGSTYTWPSSYEGAYVNAPHTYNQAGTFTLTATGTCTDGTYDYPAMGTATVTVGGGQVEELAGIMGVGLGAIGIIPVAGAGTGAAAGPSSAAFGSLGSTSYFPEGFDGSGGIWGGQGDGWMDPSTYMEASLWSPPTNLPPPPFSAPSPSWMPQLPPPVPQPVTEVLSDSLIVPANSEGVVNMAATISVQGGDPTQPFTYTWRADDGTTYSCTGGSDSSFTHWFQKPGTHTLSVTVSQNGRVVLPTKTFVQSWGAP